MTTTYDCNTTNVLAIDIGGSKLLTAVAQTTASADGGKEVVLQGIARRTLARSNDVELVWHAILDAIQETIRSTGFEITDISRIGATIPGVADPFRGFWVYAPFSGISNFPLAERLCAEFGRPAFADNDVNACAWAEKQFGVCRNVDNYLWLTVSNGIGGGLVLNGQVYAGKFAGAAEIGHFNVVDDGPLCGCGNHGCLEAVASGQGIARAYRVLLQSAITDSGDVSAQTRALWFDYLKFQYSEATTDAEIMSKVQEDTEHATAAMIAEWARQGNPLAKLVYDNTGSVIGRALSWAANLVNPEKIVLGGGVAGSFDLLYPTMWDAFQKRLFKSVNTMLTIERTGLGYEAGLMGATALAIANPYRQIA
ncbi:MAG: ROK family protein [Planctomycetia bacterium]|nr:ROK family protein [Planctomycetia bacterium]